MPEAWRYTAGLPRTVEGKASPGRGHLTRDMRSEGYAAPLQTTGAGTARLPGTAGSTYACSAPQTLAGVSGSGRSGGCGPTLGDVWPSPNYGHGAGCADSSAPGGGCASPRFWPPGDAERAGW